MDALFGKARFLLLRCNFSHSLEVLNQAVASYPGFLPAIIEKMKVLLALQDWEQAIDTAHRCLGQDVNCIEANRVIALSLLVREGDFNSAAEKITTIIQLLDQFEPSNHGLYYDASLALARLSDGRSLVLQQTTTLVERAISLAPNNSLYITELAYQHRLNGQLKESLQTYRKAFNQDETSVSALAGIIYCQLVDGQLAEAEQQLEFLNEVQSSIGKQAELIFLHALLGQKEQKPVSEVTAHLDEVVEVHLSTTKGVPLSEKYYQLINPYFLHEIATLFMTFAPTDPVSSQSQVSTILRKAQGAVEVVLKCAPGMFRTLFLVGKVKFLSGDVSAAQVIVERCIERDNSSMEAHLLMAQIHLKQGNLRQCSSSLEQALSSNFQVQSYAVYHLVKALTEKNTGDIAKALTSLETALNLVTSKRSSKSLLPPLSPSECVTVYLELVSVHTQLGHTHEAAKVMQDAINKFAGTPEEVRISIANADLALARGDSDQALTLLKSITDDKPYYIQAVEKMAGIYFKERKEKKMYVQCYKELSVKLPGPPTTLLLGDAYMNVQEPELAVEVYESALKSNPRDGVLASKVGQALVKTHHYSKAINYYEAALKTGNQPFLRGDLAELYLKLRQYDRAEKTLMVALDHKGQEINDLTDLMNNSKYLLLLAKVQQGANKPDQVLETLSRARDIQLRVVKRVGLEQPDLVPEQRLSLAKICSKLAECNMVIRIHNYPEAQRLYREALTYDDNFTEARLALASLFLLKGELDLCEQECVSLLRVDPDNEKATLLRADLLFHLGDHSKAAGHFQDLLRKKPTHFEALARLIELNRRSGQLMNSVPYLEDASKACARSAYEPGLNYCRGLMKRYQHCTNEALHCFNQARKDSEWGERALFAMVEICLNPENKTLGGETFKPSDEGSTGSNHEDQMAVKTAEKLLKEVHPRSPQSEQRVVVLENYILLATKNKQNVERALERFMGMAAEERDSVSVLLGVATAHMLLKQVPRARNQLKRLSKMTWTSADAEDLEKSWLLLADIYIQNNKPDVAIEVLKKCTTYNQSCSKAWEYLGYICEKESAYKDAATNYENAWKYCHFSDPNVGYRLAFNYMKAKRFVEAVGVCHKVLEKHPSYPKIKKEILDKARLSLRP